MKAVTQQAGKQVAQKWDDLGKLMHCFVAGTLVDTPRGKVAIERIESGDEVYAFDNARRQRVIGRVGEVYRHWTGQLVSVRTEEGVVRSTRKHRFWVESSGEWLAAAELQPGMTLRNGRGEEVILLEVSRQEEQADTFNFEVIGEHNYFVGPAALLVHNQNPPNTAPFTELDKLPADKIPKYIRESDFYKSRDVTKEYSFYEIIDKKTGKPVYVGQTTDPMTREQTHVREKLKKNGFDPKHFKIETINDEPLKMNSYQAAATEQHYIKEKGTKGIKLKTKDGKMVEIGNKINAIGKSKFNWLMRYIGCP